MYNDTAYLISQTDSVNDAGDPITIDGTPRLVYVDAKSVRQSEFYQAQAVGLRPQHMFEMRYDEYQDEPKLTFKDKPYRVLRTYRRNYDFIELVVTGWVKGVS